MAKKNKQQRKRDRPYYGKDAVPCGTQHKRYLHYQQLSLERGTRVFYNPKPDISARKIITELANLIPTLAWEGEDSLAEFKAVFDDTFELLTNSSPIKSSPTEKGIRYAHYDAVRAIASYKLNDMRHNRWMAFKHGEKGADDYE